MRKHSKNNDGRNTSNWSVGVKELKSPFRKKQVSEEMGKKKKSCMLIVYINTVTQKEQKNICQASATKNRGTHPHKVNRFEHLAILASDLSLSPINIHFQAQVKFFTRHIYLPPQR